MSRPADVRRRQMEPELMDDPSLETGRHLRALSGLERINRWSASVATLWAHIRALAAPSSGSSLRLLDLATGAGDVPIGLWHRARAAGWRVTIDGCDRSPRAMAHAKRRAGEHGADVGFFTLDAATGDLPAGYDVLTASLFLHHLPDQQVVALLRRMAQAAARCLVVSDLERSLPGLCLAYAATRLLSRSDVVHADGPRSVRAAYTLPEIRSLARQAGLERARVSRCWPCRFLLTWERR